MRSFADLPFNAYLSTEGAQALDHDFLLFLQQADANLYAALLNYRAGNTTEPLSEFLMALAIVIENFLAHFFNIETALQTLQDSILIDQPIFQFKKEFVNKRAKRRLTKNEILPDINDLNTWLKNAIHSNNHLLDESDELAIAHYGLSLIAQADEAAIEKLTLWCIHQLQTHCTWASFKMPHKLDYEHLIPKVLHPRHRDGFDLTDTRMSARAVQQEIHYCVYCHKNEDDFCRKGFPNNKKQPELGFKKNPLDVTLHGCPLDENISEMNLLKREAYSIAALAMITKENPLCALTGHRICNDCMKSCIYQKQDPVNIPEIETRILTDVLALPLGVEIYLLLMRWNPLRATQYYPKSYNDKKIMIAGFGPAGITLAHHLLMEGCAIFGFDGLKLEALSAELLQAPILHYSHIEENLSTRIMQGFGGVAEYGITVRWDKNFLKLIYIALMRRPYFQAAGSIRLGGTIHIEDAWALGFDHVCLAVGAGLPKALPIPGSLAPGMRQANDFLMALQLTGAAKKESLANLQIRMPILVIGGGLTGVDTATEAQAYYLIQIEKTYQRYHRLCTLLGTETVRAQFNALDLEILDEHLQHAKIVQEERARARAENRLPHLQRVLQTFGGVTLVYRRRMQESPAYISNHEELTKALEEGIVYAENKWPKEVLLDQYGHVSGLRCRVRHHDDNGQWSVEQDHVDLPAKTILVATGAQLNIAYAFEHKHVLERQGMQYRTYEDQAGTLTEITHDRHCKDDAIGPFTSYDQHDKRVSFIGDSHPVFHGNVVKAIASAKQSYLKIMAALPATTMPISYEEFAKKMAAHFDSYIVDMQFYHEKIIEMTLYSPAAITHFNAGHFYRLQNYETPALRTADVSLQTEAIAVFGKSIAREKNTITVGIIDQGASTHLAKRFKIGERVAFMGPTGAANRLKDHENMLIIGAELAAIQAISTGLTLKNASHHLTYVGLTADIPDPYKEELSKVCDQVIFTNDLYETLRKIDLKTMQRILIIGSPTLMRDFKLWKNTHADLFCENLKLFGSAYTPMQCMLKGVCSQCLQWQIDPHTGKRTKAVFSCSWQHPPLDLIDLDNLEERLSQNRMQEILTRLYVENVVDGG